MHFTTLVVVPHADSSKEAEKKAEQLLSPFRWELDEPVVQEPSQGQMEDFFYFVDHNPKDGLVEGTSGNLSSEEAVLPENKEWLRKALSAYFYDGEEDHFFVDEETGNLVHESYSNHRNGKWDWYSLGGRWRGVFLLKEGVPSTLPRSDGSVPSGDEPRLGGRGIFSSSRYEDISRTADVARKRDVDFAAMRAKAKEEAHAKYDEFEKATAGIAPPESWWDIQDAAVASGADINELRRQYWDNPWAKALRENMLDFLPEDALDTWFVHDGGREAFVRHASNKIVATYSVLHEGVWRERKSGQRWAKAEQEWVAWCSEFIDGLPEESWLLVYDLHS